MCLCCAARLEVLGAGKGGAGPLPKPERRRSPSRTRSRTPPPRQEHTMPPPGEGYCSSESDSDRRSARWGPGGRRPSPRSPPGHGKPDRSRPDPEGGMAEDDERPEFHNLDMCSYKIIPYMAPFEQVWGLKWSNAISPKLLENSRCKGAHFWTCLYTETKVHCARGSFLDMSLH